ncbi:hypothetical protein B0T14DRAFT_518 [Immersiella caudata]|uniref:Uncharacterized protein n=1 Tax=Immersiella caudata TaxID=314043 RepID=A0AA40CBA9_9PEZI|nr:hypothetical protein B0T14DRAFT_518 [Immersiella caudata]
MSLWWCAASSPPSQRTSSHSENPQTTPHQFLQSAAKMHSPTILLLTLATTALSTNPSLHVRHPSPAAIFNLTPRQSGSCLSSERSCGDSCIPSSASCCSASEGSFCPSGYRCQSDGCCEIGELCSGPGIGCPNGSERCGLDCVLEGDCPGGGSGGSGSGTTTTSSTRTRTTTTSTPTSTQTREPGGNPNGVGAVQLNGGVLLGALVVAGVGI